MSHTSASMLLRGDGLQFTVGKHALLQTLDIEINRGEIWAIVGPNGAGKSTLMSILSGIQAPTRGSLYWNESPSTSETGAPTLIELARMEPSQLAQRRSYLPQQNATDLGFTVQEVVSMAHYPWRRTSSSEHLNTVLDWFELDQLRNRPFNQLSGGERQRTHLARTCLQIMANGFQHRLLLLDEPLTGLDIAHQVALFERLKTIQSQGAAMVMVLHDINLARRFCTHCLLLDNGQPVIQGRADDVLTAERLSQVFNTPLLYSATPSPHFYWANS